MSQFKNRFDAGQKLAEKLGEYQEQKNVLIIGLPTSMVTACEVAKRLDAFLDICVPKLVYAPQKPELIIGAATSDGMVMDEEALGKNNLKPIEESDHFYRYRGEAKTFEKRYRGSCKKRNPAGHKVIVVTDGDVNPLLIRAVLNNISGQSPEELILACPLITSKMFDACSGECDDVVCCDTVNNLEEFYAAYESFEPAEESEVHALLEKCQKK